MNINGIIQYVVFCKWLLSLSIKFSRVIHVVACIITSFIFILMIFHVWLYILFIQSSVDDIWVVSTLGLLWIMLLWIFRYKFLRGHMFSFFLSIHLGVEPLDPMVTLCLTFKELSDCLTKQLHHFTFPPAMYKGSNFCTSLPTLAMLCLFDYTHPSVCEVVSHCGFGLHFPDGWWYWASFYMLIGHLYIFSDPLSIS